MLHTASLVHDDVLDECDLRRGAPCHHYCCCLQCCRHCCGSARLSAWSCLLSSLLLLLPLLEVPWIGSLAGVPTHTGIIPPLPLLTLLPPLPPLLQARPR